jgi:hypothetical protein
MMPLVSGQDLSSALDVGIEVAFTKPQVSRCLSNVNYFWSTKKLPNGRQKKLFRKNRKYI